MTTETLPPPPATSPSLSSTPGHYGFVDAVRAEWVKFRTVRSSLWCLGVFELLMVGFAVIASWATVATWGRHPDAALNFDPFSYAMAGVTMATLAIGVLGVMVVSAEYSTGSIRSTFAAVPRRGLVIAAKATVLGTVTAAATVVGEVIAFLVSQAILATGHAATTPFGTQLPKPSTEALTSAGVAGGLVRTACYVVLLTMLCLGLGTIIRHTAGAISAFVGVLFPLFIVIALLPSDWKDKVQKFLPLEIQQTVTISKPSVRTTEAMSATSGLVAMAIYAAIAIGVGTILTLRRDA